MGLCEDLLYKKGDESVRCKTNGAVKKCNEQTHVIRAVNTVIVSRSIQTDGQTDVFEVIRPCVKHPSNGLLYHRATANMVSIATNV
ncbi:hypothetical protein J6590_093518 [Homalodisca vitripennis]|nr:hypothetical protein J6590_093518 [Homalodisca vitripennis]